MVALATMLRGLGRASCTQASSVARTGSYRVTAAAAPCNACSTSQRRPLVVAHALRQPDRAAAAVGGPWRQCSSSFEMCKAGQHQAMAGNRHVATAAAAAQGGDKEDKEDDEEGMIGELGDVPEGMEDWEELEDNVGPEVSTGGVEWGERALAVVQQLLAAEGAGGATHAELVDIQLFSFRAIPSAKRLDIRLDKLTDQYGSPSLDDVAAFSRLFNEAYEATVGEAVAGDIEVEVSSPGAERQVRVPGELQRFAELPMKVEYVAEGDKVDTKVLNFSELDAAAGLTRWKLADVRANRNQAGKGRGLNRKQRDAVYELPLAAVRRVNLYLDF